MCIRHSSTGGILALASVPGFDANLFVTGIGVEAYRSLSQSPDKPLFNRALRGQYSPASTLKPMLAIAALDSNATTRDRTIWHIYRCPRSTLRHPRRTAIRIT